NLLENSDVIDFYNELYIILWNVIAGKLQLSPSKLNKINVSEELKLKGWNDEMLLNLNLVLTECEKNLYLSNYRSDTHWGQQLQNAERVMTELQNM
ncbi:MAG: hypothetical protein H7246_14480, partial [Phycisphaerae bacterium]|nr:hypothetical protein [Saprospiraceae bacterium]